MVKKEIFTLDDFVITRYAGKMGKLLKINCLLNGRKLVRIAAVADVEIEMSMLLDDNKTIFERFLLHRTLIERNYGFRTGNLNLKLEILNPDNTHGELELQVVSK